MITLGDQRRRGRSARVSDAASHIHFPVLSLSAEVEAEPAPAGLGLALCGQGAEVVARVQDPAGELLGHRGAHEAGMHAEHANLRPGQFAGQQLGQPGDAALATANAET